MERDRGGLVVGACAAGRCGREASTEHGFCCDWCEVSWAKNWQPAVMHSERCNRANTLPDPGRPLEGWSHRDGPDTEKLAAERIMPRSGTQRRAVLDHLIAVGEHGTTDNETYNAVAPLCAYPHVAGARRLELKRDGWPIVDSGRRRETDAGHMAVVWKLNEATKA